MQSEWIAVIAIIICLFILGLEYLWLAMLSKRRSDSYEKYKNISLKVAQMVEGILYSPTANSRQNETKALKELVGILKEAGNMLSEWEEQAHPGEDVSFSEEQTTGVIILPEVKQESE